MDIQELLKCAEAYRGLLDRLALIKEDMADLEQITKERAVLTNMELRAFKRILKAEHKDQLDKLDEQTEAQSYLRDVLTDKKVVDNKIVAIPHSPDTGEVIESPSAAPYGDERGASSSKTQRWDAEQPQTEGEKPSIGVTGPQADRANSSNSPHISDNRTPDEIIGDMPQICRRA